MFIKILVYFFSMSSTSTPRGFSTLTIYYLSIHLFALCLSLFSFDSSRASWVLERAITVRPLSRLFCPIHFLVTISIFFYWNLNYAICYSY